MKTSNKIILSTISGEGFGSIIKFFTFRFRKKPGLIIISGENGVGKTTIFSLLIWVLYGIPIKGKTATVPTWLHLRDNEWRGTMGSVSFYKDEIKYTITRCIDYKGKVYDKIGGDRLILDINGEIFPKGKAETNAEIIKILGYSFDVFKNSILFGQKVKRLIEEEGPVQKKLLEEAFSLGFLNKAKELAEVELNDIRTGLELNSHSLELVITQLKYQRTLRTELTSGIKADDQSLQKTRNRLIDQISEANAELRKYRKTSQKFESTQIALKALHTKISEYDHSGGYIKIMQDLSKYQNLRKQAKIEIAKLEELTKSYAKNPICLYCNQPLPKKDWGKHLREHKLEIQDLQSKKQSCIKQIMRLSTLAASLEELNKQLEILNKENYELGASLKAAIPIEKRRDKYIAELEALKSVKPTTNRLKLQQIKKALRKSVLKKLELTKIRDILIEKENLYNWVISKPLSNAGLKTFMFNYFLDQLNNRLVMYGETVPYIPQLMIDFESAHKRVISKVFHNGIELPSMVDLSGGQSQLCNSLIALAANDIIAENINILLLDEIFESLSSTNIEIISEIIQEKAKEKTIYLITHRDEFSPLNTTSISLSLVNGNSSIT